MKKILDQLTGSPGSWVQLRLQRRGKSEPIEASVQRQWLPGTEPVVPKSGHCVTMGTQRGVFQFRSADTFEVFASISTRDLQSRGQRAVSPDCKRFAAVGRVIDSKDFCLEVHSLESGELERSAILIPNNYRALRFSPKGDRVLVGTRDTVEVFDIENNLWLPRVTLTAKRAIDPGREVNRRIPLGIGLPGDLYITSRDVVYSKPAALSTFDVGPNGMLAVGSELGELMLASLETKQRVGVLGDNILGDKAEMVRFSPTGRHLVAYAKGVLHLFELDDSDANSEMKAAAGTLGTE